MPSVLSETLETVTQDTAGSSRVGFIAIGRNEGERLRLALSAIQRLYPEHPAVYVDSGSTDGSVGFARSIGMTVVELDLSRPFTAARARNAGAERLVREFPETAFIQFLDGDCELLPGWLEAGLAALTTDDVAIASGRRAERYPEASIYNTLMDKEWDTPVGEIMGVPGDMLVKARVFRELCGFDDSLIAGEDFDLCLRAAALGYKTLRVDAPMSLHDADISHFSQWYRRTKRGGHAWINLYQLHGAAAGGYFKHKIARVLAWAVAFPAMLLASLLMYPAAAVALVLLQLLMVGRSLLRQLVLGDSLRVAAALSALVYVGKYAELAGMLEYARMSRSRQPHTLIEYK